MRAELMEATTEQALDDILALKEPERTHALTEWVDNGEPIILKAQRAPWRVVHDGKVYNISAKGRTVDRRAAVYLLLKYGKNGKYYNVDQATGINPNVKNQIEARDDESTKYWRKRGLPEKFETNYLYHDVKSSQDDAEA